MIGVDQAGRSVYWIPPGSAFHPQFLKDAKAVRHESEQQESNRLLYVALTRACEGLVIAGWEKSRGVRTLDGSDYAAVKSALGTLADVVETDDGHMQLYTATRIAEPSESARTAILPDKKAVAPDPSDLDWIDQPFQRDAPAGKPGGHLSRGLDYAPSSVTSVAEGQRRLSALANGRLAHRLLEILPSVPAPGRGDVSGSIMRQYDDLTDAAKDDILQRVQGIIEMPKLVPLFSSQALAEVPINGRVYGVGVAGQIDRLYVDEDQIILADFKTGQRPDGPPPHGYVEQLALYDALLGQIYPDRQITSWLIWTQTNS